MILSSARCSIHGSAQFGAGLLLCSRDNRRKELFMSAKDKEKLNMAGTIVSLLKGDTIVIDPDEFRRRADIKNKEFYEVEKDTGCKEEKKVPGLTDAEMLCCDNGRQLSLKNDAVLGENGHVEGKRKLLLPERSETNLEVVRYLSSRGAIHL